MTHYLKLLFVFYKNSLLAEMEYRVNFLVNSLLSLFWMFWGIASVSVFFLHRDSLGGWSYLQALIVLGLFRIFTGLIDGVLRPNIYQVVEYVRRGTLDFVLTKPVNSQFLATLRHIALFKGVDILLGAGLISYAASQLGITPSPGQIALFIVLLLSGGVIIYSLCLLLITTSFWFVKVDNITEVIFTMYETGRVPATVFSGWIRILITFVVPIAFMTTIPAQAILGTLSWSYALLSLLLATLLLSAASGFWRYALRYYSSASS